MSPSESGPCSGFGSMSESYGLSSWPTRPSTFCSSHRSGRRSAPTGSVARSVHIFVSRGSKSEAAVICCATAWPRCCSKEVPTFDISPRCSGTPDSRQPSDTPGSALTGSAQFTPAVIPPLGSTSPWPPNCARCFQRALGGFSFQPVNEDLWLGSWRLLRPHGPKVEDLNQQQAEGHERVGPAAQIAHFCSQLLADQKECFEHPSATTFPCLIPSTRNTELVSPRSAKPLELSHVQSIAGCVDCGFIEPRSPVPLWSVTV